MFGFGGTFFTIFCSSLLGIFSGIKLFLDSNNLIPKLIARKNNAGNGLGSEVFYSSKIDQLLITYYFLLLFFMSFLV